jgi:chaperonin GroES
MAGEPSDEQSLPIKLLHDRVLVRADGADGERRSGGGIVIPATASVGKRLSWAHVVGVGPNVRTLEVGDRVLFEPQELGEVELQVLLPADEGRTSTRSLRPSRAGIDRAPGDRHLRGPLLDIGQW